MTPVEGFEAALCDFIDNLFLVCVASSVTVPLNLPGAAGEVKGPDRRDYDS